MIKKLIIRSSLFRNYTQFLRKVIEKAVYKLTNQKKALLNYKNIYAGKPILIVGNGPSLNKTVLDSFVNIPSIGMNKIDLIFSRTKWRPDIIICSNGVVIEQNKEYYSQSNIPIFLDFKAFFLNLKGKSINYFYIGNENRFLDTFSEETGWGHTVTFQALQLANFLGANPIILVGIDHNYVIEKGDKNTYQKNTKDDVNHFDPNYFGKGSIWGVPDLEGSENGYRMAKSYFESKNVQVFDATVGGKLSIFKKISIEEAIKFTK
jgi:hypothetical protein